MTLHDSARDHSLAYLYGQEPGVAARVFLAKVLWLSGYPEQALSLAHAALPLARAVAYAPSQAYALAYAAMLHQYRREPQPVRELAEAIIVAQRQSAKSLELRAVTSLARLWQQGKRTEARQILAEIYGWFSEGLDTTDLKEAKAWLDNQ